MGRGKGPSPLSNCCCSATAMPCLSDLHAVSDLLPSSQVTNREVMREEVRSVLPVQAQQTSQVCCVPKQGQSPAQEHLAFRPSPLPLFALWNSTLLSLGPGGLLSSSECSDARGSVMQGKFPNNLGLPKKWDPSSTIKTPPLSWA